MPVLHFYTFELNTTYGNLTSLNTLFGQNTAPAPPSEKVFDLHFIVKRVTFFDPDGVTYYDPSYGVTYTGGDKAAAEANFESKSVDGSTLPP